MCMNVINGEYENFITLLKLLFDKNRYIEITALLTALECTQY